MSIVCYTIHVDYSSLIKQLREKMLFTQKELAEILGVTFATVNRWEKGHHEPTMKAKRKIRSLCKKYGVPYEG